MGRKQVHLIGLKECLALCMFLAISGCATIPSKTVTLYNEAGQTYHGILDYVDGLSGTITMDKGPDGESFSGSFVVVDRTSTSTSGGVLLAPAVNGGQPFVGGTNSTSSGYIDAGGFWQALGSNGASLECELLVGRQGHGKGTCKHSNGQLFKVFL